VYHIQVTQGGELKQLLQKSMALSCIIEDEQMHLSDAENLIAIEIKATI
jgi:uncharacterized protein YaeQ